VKLKLTKRAQVDARAIKIHGMALTAELGATVRLVDTEHGGCLDHYACRGVPDVHREAELPGTRFDERCQM